MSNPANRWQLQDAKARLSELVQCAQTEGPQTITLRGKEAVVVVAASDYERLTRPKTTLLEALMNSPIREEDEHLFDRHWSPGTARTTEPSSVSV